MSGRLILSWHWSGNRFIRNYSAWYFYNIIMERRPRWLSRRGRADQFDDYTLNEFTAIDPHELSEVEIPAFVRAFKRLFGEDTYTRMTESSLPSRAEHYLESECECGERLYTFLQRLNDNPFELESETDSQASEDSGNNATCTSASASENEEENVSGDDCVAPPAPPPRSQSPQSPQSPESPQPPQSPASPSPPAAKRAKLDS